MAKAPKAQKKVVSEIEVEPDAWERFRRAIRIAVKAGPQHRKTKPKRRAGKKGIAAAAMLLTCFGAFPSAQAASWISCQLKMTAEALSKFRPEDRDQIQTHFIFAIDGTTLYSYDPHSQVLNPTNWLVGPNRIVDSPSFDAAYIDRQTGAFHWAEGSDGTCIAIDSQPVAKPKF